MNLDFLVGAGIFIAIVLMNISAFPQIFKIIKTKQVRDLSIKREFLLLVGCLIYLILGGIYLKVWYVILSNSIATFIFISYIYLYYKYRNKKVLIEV